jgi:putative transposase
MRNQIAIHRIKPKNGGYIVNPITSIEEIVSHWDVSEDNSASAYAFFLYTVAEANRHDMKLVAATLEALEVERPEAGPQHLCLDKGYDYPQVRELVELWGYTAHLRSRGEEKLAKAVIPGYRARRWVVERTHSWLNRFRRLLIRWEKDVDNYLGMLHLACAWITFEPLELSDRLLVSLDDAMVTQTKEEA